MVMRISNVGIKEGQKTEIEKLVRETGEYKSINEFVQEAVASFISKKKTDKSGKSTDSTKLTLEIKKALEQVLHAALQDKIILSNSATASIRNVMYQLDDFEKKTQYAHKSDILLEAFDVKKSVDIIIGNLINDNEFEPNARKFISNLQKAKKCLIDSLG